MTAPTIGAPHSVGRSEGSASRPAGTVPDEATLSGQAGVIGDQFNDLIIKRTADYFVRLEDIGFAQLAPEEERRVSRFKVRIAGTTAGRQEPSCIPETICVSGALAAGQVVGVRTGLGPWTPARGCPVAVVAARVAR